MTIQTPTDFNPPEDHEPTHLTEAQIDQIVDRAVNKVFDRIYQEVGKSVLKKLAWFVGLAITAVVLWLAGTGKLPK